MPPEMATQDEWWWYCWGCLRPEFDGVTVEWKPFGVKPILVHPLLRKQDKPLFCFRLQPLSHAHVQQCFLEDTDSGWLVSVRGMSVKWEVAGGWGGEEEKVKERGSHWDRIRHRNEKEGVQGWKKEHSSQTKFDMLCDGDGWREWAGKRV